MIEHKRIKAICAVVLSALVAVSMAVPCFATEVVSLNRLYAYCRVTSDGSTTSYNITSLITSSFDYSTYTYTVSIPYTILPQLGEGDNAYITALYFYIGDSDGGYFDSIYYYSADLEMDYTIVDDEGSFSGSPYVVTRLQDYSSVRSGTSVSGYQSFNESFTRSKSFDAASNSYFYITFTNFLAFGQISFTFTISLTLNDTSVALDSAGDDLLDLADNLAVPTPAIDVDSIVDDALSDADMDSVGDVWSFMSNDLITKMLLIVVSFALLGYILYGKKEAGN